MVRLILVFLTSLLMMPVIAAAQDSLPPCTYAQAQAAYALLEATSFVSEFQNAAKAISDDATSTEIPHDGFMLLDALQRKWWEDIAPALPDCGQAQHLALVGGRMLDEMLIGLSVSHWAMASTNGELADSIRQHKNAALELNVQLSVITQEMGAIQPGGLGAAANQAAATLTPSSTGGDSRTNPVPFGQSHLAETFDTKAEITITGYQDDGEAFVLAANDRNVPAPAGKRYVVIDMHFACASDATASCEFSRSHYSLVGDKGMVYEYDAGEDLARISDIGDDQEIFGGAAVDVTVAFLVDADDGHFVLFTQYGDPRVFFATE